MYGSRIVSGLAVVFAGMAVLFAGLAVAYNPVFLAVAALFGLAAYFVWYHASGRLASRLYRGVHRQAEPTGPGAGPREDWGPPRDGRRAREQAARQQQARAGRARGRGSRQRTGRRTGRRAQAAADGPTIRQAYETLGLDADADESAVRAAYREKVKEVHPDRPSGDEAEFKAVKDAYERLTGD